MEEKKEYGKQPGNVQFGIRRAITKEKSIETHTMECAWRKESRTDGKGKGEKRNMENKGKTEKKQKKRIHTAVRIWRKTWKQEMPTL